MRIGGHICACVQAGLCGKEGGVRRVEATCSGVVWRASDREEKDTAMEVDAGGVGELK